jgi:hypothetical protein
MVKQMPAFVQALDYSLYLTLKRSITNSFEYFVSYFFHEYAPEKFVKAVQKFSD